MKYNKIALATVAALSLTAPQMAAAENVKQAQPNVLMLVLDDANDMINPDTPSGVRAITPNLDRIKARGVTFTNAHAPAVYCAPSRAAIMTGMSVANSGMYFDNPVQVNAPDKFQMPKWFSKNGYKSMGAGKVYHHMPGYTDIHAFDDFLIWNKNLKKKGWGVDSWGKGSPHPGIGKVGKGVWKNFDIATLPNSDEVKMADTITAELVVDWIKDNAKSDQPFFAAYGTYAPHKPNYVPQKYIDMYPLDKLKLPVIKKGDIDDLEGNIAVKMKNRGERFDNLRAQGWEKEVLQHYLASVSYADAQFGKVLDVLEESGELDNTIIVVWSDNGYHMGEKDIYAKHTFWQRTTNVPFIWAGPGIPEGTVNDSPVDLLDTYRTLTDLAGIKDNKDAEGVSLRYVFEDAGKNHDRTITVTEAPGSYALMNNDWRFIHHEDGAEELYDLKADVHEHTNLIHDAKYAKVIEQLRAQAPKSFAPVGLKGGKKGDLALKKHGEDFTWVVKKK